jgi:hypothetical protein
VDEVDLENVFRNLFIRRVPRRVGDRPKDRPNVKASRQGFAPSAEFSV